MIRHKSKKYNIDKKIKKKILLAIVLFVLLIVDIIYVGFFRNKSTSNDKASQTEDETKVETISTESVFVNSDEFITPLVGENVAEIENEICEFYPGINMNSVTFFSVHIPKSKENTYWFFAEIEGEETPIRISYNYKTDYINIEWSSYTKEEILDEIWDGVIPDVQDMPDATL